MKKINNPFVTRRKMLYKAGKPKRGTAFEIYTDGTIILITKITKPGIHIATRIQKWMDLKKSNIENMNSIKAEIIVNKDNLKEKKVINQTITLTEKTNGWYIELLNGNEPLREISQNIGSNVTCKIYGLQPTKEYYKVKELFDKVKIENSKQALISNVGKGTKFSIYQTDNGCLQIESYCTMDESGRLEISDEIGRYIKDWWKDKHKFVIAQLNNNTQLALRMTQRQNKTRRKKHVVVPYYGQRKRVKILFTHPTFMLSEQAKQDLAITKELQQAGYAIKHIITNWYANSQHVDALFEAQVNTILEYVFKMHNTIIFSEVKITSSSSPEITKCLDGILIWKDQLGLIEIKTSEKIKNYALDEVLGELLHLQKQLQTRNIFSLVFINTEVTTTELGRNITKLYGLANNVILIGKEEVQALAKNPKKIIKRILEFQSLMKGKRENNQFIHPLTQKLTTKESLEKEAYLVLEQSLNRSAESKKYIDLYCILMNLTIGDFFLLYNSIAGQKNNKVNYGYSLQNQRKDGHLLTLDREIVKNLHQSIILNNNRRILEEKSKRNEKLDFSVLFDNWQVISNNLPSMCKIYQFKTFKRKEGYEYEQQIRKQLEKQGFQVASNVLISYYGKHFEIDHLIFKDGEMQAISCKNRSVFRYLPKLYTKIREAIGNLTLHQKTINCNKSQLYIKVNETFIPMLNEIFWEFGTEIFTLILTK